MDCGDLVDAMVTVASENVYWRYRPGRTRAVYLSRGWLTPLITGTIGYLPWSRFSRAEDMPGRCRTPDGCRHAHPGGMLDDPTMPTQRYASFRAPVLGYSIDDYPEATRTSVDAMMAAYPNVERRHLTPADSGLDQIGLRLLQGLRPALLGRGHLLAQAAAPTHATRTLTTQQPAGRKGQNGSTGRSLT